MDWIEYAMTSEGLTRALLFLATTASSSAIAPSTALSLRHSASSRMIAVTVAVAFRAKSAPMALPIPGKNSTRLGFALISGASGISRPWINLSYTWEGRGPLLALIPAGPAG